MLCFTFTAIAAQNDLVLDLAKLFLRSPSVCGPALLVFKVITPGCAEDTNETNNYASVPVWINCPSEGVDTIIISSGNHGNVWNTLNLFTL
jgi:hypothetical protein